MHWLDRSLSGRGQQIKRKMFPLREPDPAGHRHQHAEGAPPTQAQHPIESFSIGTGWIRRPCAQEARHLEGTLPTPLLALLHHRVQIRNRPYLNRSKSILKAWKL